MRTRPFLIAATLCLVAATCMAMMPVSPIPTTVETDPVPPFGDGMSKQDLMRAKLSSSSLALDGLVNGDFDTLRTASGQLLDIAEASPRRYENVREMAVYEHFRDEFVRLSQRLEQMSEDRNLEGAAYVHQNLTANCIACHQHMRAGRRPRLPGETE